MTHLTYSKTFRSGLLDGITVVDQAIDYPTRALAERASRAMSSRPQRCAISGDEYVVSDVEVRDIEAEAFALEPVEIN